MHCRLLGASANVTQETFAHSSCPWDFVLKLNFNQFRFVCGAVPTSVPDPVPSGCQPFFACWGSAKKINLSKLQTHKHTQIHRQRQMRSYSQRQNNHMSNLSRATKQYKRRWAWLRRGALRDRGPLGGFGILWICG